MRAGRAAVVLAATRPARVDRQRPRLRLALDDHDEPPRAVHALDPLSSMSLVADGPGDEHDRPALARARLERAISSGTVSTIWPARTTQTCRSGTRLSARRPCPAPPSRAIVPVSAQPAAHVVSAPSSASSSLRRERRVLDELEAGGSQRASRSAAIPIRRAPCGGEDVGRRRRGSSRATHRRRGSREPARRKRHDLAGASAPRSTVAPRHRQPAARSPTRRADRAPAWRHARVTGLPPLAERLRRQRRQVARSGPRRRAAPAGTARSSRRGRTAVAASRASRCARS